MWITFLEDFMERISQTMTTTGAGSVALGIVVLVTGIATGVVAIVNGARLLKDRKRIIF